MGSHDRKAGVKGQVRDKDRFYFTFKKKKKITDDAYPSIFALK